MRNRENGIVTVKVWTAATGHPGMEAKAQGNCLGPREQGVDITVPLEFKKSHNVFKIKHVLKYLMGLASSCIQVAWLLTHRSPSLPWEI